MTSSQVVKTSATNNTSFQNYLHPQDHTRRTTFNDFVKHMNRRTVSEDAATLGVTGGGAW